MFFLDILASNLINYKPTPKKTPQHINKYNAHYKIKYTQNQNTTNNKDVNNPKPFDFIKITTLILYSKQTLKVNLIFT